MNTRSIRAHKITSRDSDILAIVDRYVTELDEKSVLAIASKIVAVTQGRLKRKTTEEAKNKLIEEEAGMFLPPESNKYPFYLTIKHGILIPNAGIDESNAGDHLILWPKKPHKVADEVRMHLKKRFRMKHVGVIITDSTTRPLRWGVTGIALAHSGFAALNDYVGKRDIFGRKLRVTKVNVADALATSATLMMGEGAEQTPFSVIEELPFVRFQDRSPTKQELKDLRISMDNDIFAPLLKSARWKKPRA